MYSAETIKIAEAAAHHPAVRASLRACLNAMETPDRYSNERFDKTQQFASLLSDIAKGDSDAKSAILG